MGLEAFPEIENFQKLPHQVIVKGGTLTFDEKEGAQLRGLVINNIGHTILDIRVNAVIFDKNKIPVLSTSTDTHPAVLPQGEMGTFLFQFKDCSTDLSDYHLFANWKFDDQS